MELFCQTPESSRIIPNHPESTQINPNQPKSTRINQEHNFLDLHKEEQYLLTIKERKARVLAMLEAASEKLSRHSDACNLTRFDCSNPLFDFDLKKLLLNVVGGWWLVAGLGRIKSMAPN